MRDSAEIPYTPKMGPLHRFVPLVAAFAVGACAATAIQSSASTSEPVVTPADSPTKAATVWPLITTDAEAQRRTAPNGKAQVTILARGHNAFVAHLTMEAGAAVPEHRDSTEEYIHVLEGSGTITIDGEIFELHKGSTVYMPADAKVEFHNGDTPLSGIQVFAGPQPAAKYDAWSAIE